MSETRELNVAFILTHDRRESLRRSLRAIASQVSQVCVIDNASSPPVTWDDVTPLAHTLVHDGHQPPNLATLMNVGFEWAAEQAVHLSYERWNVACLCDDIEAPATWFADVVRALRASQAVAGSTHQFEPRVEPLLKTAPDHDIFNRMQGSACVFRGEVGLRADERMHWWWQDTDLDWQARAAGGMIIAPGPVAVNQRPNDFTNAQPELAHRAGLDGEVFREKWGFKPW